MYSQGLIGAKTDSGEDEAFLAAFQARTPDARLQPLDARFGHDTGAGHQRFPGEDGLDGFFYARLVKG